MSARTHYAGGLVYTAGRGGSRRVEVRRGYPVCCDGERAETILRRADIIWDRALVDCTRCLALIAREVSL